MADQLPVICLLISPLDPMIGQVLEEIIRPAAAGAEAVLGRELRLTRADDITFSGDSRRSFFSLIEPEDTILVNFVSTNPNVVYELALAHAVGRGVIMLSNRTEFLPFNLMDQRVSMNIF